MMELSDSEAHFGFLTQRATSYENVGCARRCRCFLGLRDLQVRPRS